MIQLSQCRTCGMLFHTIQLLQEVRTMKAFYRNAQSNHVPQSYLSRGQLRTPQEIPERTAEIKRGLKMLDIHTSWTQDHGMEAISAVHGDAYLDFLRTAHREWTQVGEDWGDEVFSNIFVPVQKPRSILAKAATYQADGSCPIGVTTWLSAYWSAQAAISAAKEVMQGANVAYGLCRPPGHHARPSAAGGFCYLNNGAIAAQVLRQRFKRIAIFDPDMHHGQGVQEIFYDRDDVFYVSIHGDPGNFYPVVTGYEDELGVDAGRGYNLNLPMPHGSSEIVFFRKVDTALSAIANFQPDALVVPMGFDTYFKDPQAKVSVSRRGFEMLGQAIASLHLPTVIIQEGGYYLPDLANNTQTFFTGLLAP